MKQAIVFLSVLLNTAHGMLNSALAKEFGIHGHTFEIQEPDLLKQVESKLKQWEAHGKLTELNETLIEHTQKSLSEPHPVDGITKATNSRVFEYDPSIIVPYDLKDHEGRVFHKAGTKLNSLKFLPLPQPLVFLDGRDKAQVLWVEKTYLETRLQTRLTTNKPPKIILIAGSPFQLMEKWQAELDQNDFSLSGANENSTDHTNSLQTKFAQAQSVPLKSIQAKLTKDNSDLAQLGQAQPVYFDQGGVLTRKLGIRHVPAVVVQDGLKLKISEIVVDEVHKEGPQ